MSLNESQRKIIASTAPILAEHGLTVTKTFYANLLKNNPSLRSVFSVSAQLPPFSHQPAALAASLHAYATHIDDLTPILPVVERINQKHASLNITSDQYAIVGEGLLKTMADVLGKDVFTDEVRDAWTVGYNQLAAIMSGREEAMYSEHDKKQGGWRGWRSMKIVKKVRESDDATSFYFQPADGGALPDYRPGEYISVGIDVPELDYKQIRHYSLSDAPPADNHSAVTSGHANGETKTDGWKQDYTEINGHVPRFHHDPTAPADNNANGSDMDVHNSYRITVKRDPGLDTTDPSAPAHPGFVSNLLHNTYNVGDIVEMTHPAGDFFLDIDADLDTATPVVLLSAGVGLTPLMSMPQTLLKQKSPTQRKISWIHVARNKAVDPFADDVARITKEHPNVVSKVFHSAPMPHEQQGVDYDVSGRPDLLAFDETERRNLLCVDDQRTRYYMCGPNAFMAAGAKALREMEVESKRIQMELFGAGSIGA